MHLFGLLVKTLNIPLLSKYSFVLKAVLNICSLASIFLLVSMLGPAELNWPVELRVCLMPVVYGFAAYGFTGLVLAYFNYLFYIEPSIPEAGREYVEQQRARAAQKTKLYVGLIALGIAFVSSEQRNRDVILDDSAKRYPGQTKWVVGKVSQIKRVREGKVLVDFGDVYPKQTFTAVFTPQAYRDVLLQQGQIKIGSLMSVHGMIDLYAGCPEIRVSQEWDVIEHDY